jgi:hypothetical protein
VQHFHFHHRSELQSLRLAGTPLIDRQELKDQQVFQGV